MIKRKMRIKLIYPPIFRRFNQRAPPVSIPSLTAVLRENNHYVDQDDLLIKVWKNKHPKLDLSIFSNEQLLEDYLFKNRKNKKFDETLDKILLLTDYKSFNLIGLGAMSRFQFLFALLLAKKIKEQIDTPIVIGGRHSTSLTKDLFDRIKFVDYIVIGDGELAIMKLVGFLKGKNKLKDIPGLLYRKKGLVHQNQPKNMNINKIPPPDFDGLQYSSYKSFKQNSVSLAYQISRGCPFRCSFCELSAHKYEAKSIDKVVKDLKLLSEKYGITHFEFVDHTINVNYRYLDALCYAFIKKGLNITWDSYARCDSLDKALLSKMKSAGCTMLRFGVESGSNRLLRLMNKDIKSEKSAKILKWAHEEGIINSVFLISGFPGETKEDLEATLRFIKENSKYINSIRIKPFYISGNSIIKKNPKAYGIKNIKQDFNSEFFLRYDYTMSKEEISKQFSHIKLLEAYFKYILRNRFPLFRLIPYFVYKLILKREQLHYKIIRYFKYNSIFKRILSIRLFLRH